MRYRDLSAGRFLQRILCGACLSLATLTANWPAIAKDSSPVSKLASDYRPEPVSGQGGYRKLNIEGFDKYCVEFNVSSNDRTIRPLLSELKDKNFSVAETLSTPICVPSKGNEKHTLMPMFHYAAESPDNCFNFPKHLYEFFLREKNPDGFTQVVNSKNKLGQTFLDYLKYRYDDQKSSVIHPEIEKKYISIFEYVCRRGGKFSYYKKTDCDSL